jgi:hypothetical protein
MRLAEEFLEESYEPVRYVDLARWIYDTNDPTRSQLSAVGRAVGRLVGQGKAEREEVPVVAGIWEKPVPGRPGRSAWGPPVRRGPVVLRETWVLYVEPEDRA